MNWEDNDDDFDFEFDDGLSDEEREELTREREEERRRAKNHPLARQADEVYNVVKAIVGSMEERHLDMTGELLMESAVTIRVKLAGALGSGSWLICMQNAAIIRAHAEHLRLSNHMLTMFTETDEDYAALLREEMEIFRDLFNHWAKEIHAMEHDDFDDEWGLFVR